MWDLVYCCTRLVLYMALHLWNFVRRHASFCSECGIVRAGVIRRAKYWIICVLLTTGQDVALEFLTLSQECQTLMPPWEAFSRLYKARPRYSRRPFGCYRKLLWTNSYFVYAGLQTNPWKYTFHGGGVHKFSRNLGAAPQVLGARRAT